ncbi:MAG: twin-arginine translocation signal domain-containing protein [Magnetococcales bacterium]|nr:twin-arginine translocation signal domain-containing protein [Magnetococcales bacterium]
MGMHQDNTLTRRTFLGVLGATGAVCVATGFTGLPRLAEAADAPEATVNVDELIAKEMGAGSVALEKVKIDTPSKAENGALIRMPISVDHPMEPDNYISSLAIYVDSNPKPLVGRFEFTPASGKAEVELRIKMAKASQVRAIAKSNKGKLYGAVMTIEVAEGGCAG